MNYSEAIKVNSTLFDHTHFASPSNTTYYSTRLTGGNTNATIGLAKSLSVMPGDKIDIEVFAKYVDPDPNNLTQALRDFLASIATGGSAPAGTIIDGGLAGSLGNGSFPFAGFLTHGSESGTAPKAYLNYLVFDRNFVPVGPPNTFRRVTTAARETGSGIAHELLSFNQIEIKEPGYVYIWLSNENETAVEVYFDDFKVTHTKSPIVQTDEYYPFGLTFNEYSRENSVPNLYQFNGKEKQDELGLNSLDYGARMYMSDIGRWSVIDARAHNYMSYTPYGYVANNPVNYVDYNGDFILPKEFLNRFERIAQYLAHDIQGILNNKRIVNALKKHSGYSDKQLKRIFTWGQGPVLNPGAFEGDKFSELGKTLGLMDGNYNYIPGSAYITINEDLFADLEVAKGKDRDYLLFVTAVTILHELVHYGYLENNLKTETDEEGNDFEKDAYGKVIRMSTGTHKEVFDNWQKRNGQGQGGSSGSIDYLYFFNNGSGSTNAEGDKTTKKKKKSDADREAAKRSGGGY